MDAEILVVPNCPNERPAIELLSEVLDATGHRAVQIRVTVIRTQDEAARAGFPGSPTFLINGADPFPAPHCDTALACRVYPTGDGLRGLPSRSDLIGAVHRHLATDAARDGNYRGP